ncbi:hypothetical protein ACFLYA_02275 [Candidatus Dependentiae bacterium]
MRRIIKFDLNNVLEWAKRIDLVREKLYSEEKNITKKEWKDGFEAAMYIPNYDEDISEILKTPRQEAIQYAKDIDKAIEAMAMSGEKPEEDTRFKQLVAARNVITALGKLPAYKPGYVQVIARYFPKIVNKHLDKFPRLKQKYLEKLEKKKSQDKK